MSASNVWKNVYTCVATTPFCKMFAYVWICLHDCLIPKNEFLIPYYKHRKCKKNKWINLFHDNSSTPSASPTLAFDEASQDSAQKVTCQIAWGCLEWVHHGKTDGHLLAPSWLIPSGKHSQFAIENGPVEIVDLPINSVVILHSYVNVYQSNGKSY